MARDGESAPVDRIVMRTGYTRLDQCGRDVTDLASLWSEEDDEWMPIATPPNTSRKVVMRFGNDPHADCYGFWWRAERLWYREGKTSKKHAVEPTHWREVKENDGTLLDLLRHVVAEDDGIDLYA